MKLSQMTTDHALDVFSRISIPIQNIVNDEKVTEIMVKTLKSADNVSRMSNGRFLFLVTTNLIPYILKERKADGYEIISAMTGKTLEEIRDQNFMVTIADCKDFIDRDFIDFFKSSVNAAQTKKK